ncbi:hypothetical protein FCOIX_3315 [Fusarium coicis]|nr:hypothetical protein FCOIX_3315 [Fusarium coicis]
MDLAMRTLDLSRAILDILNKENSVRDAAGEILEWLGRECIDKQEYQYCVEALSAQPFRMPEISIYSTKFDHRNRKSPELPV